jgi:hypothetical protein
MPSAVGTAMIEQQQQRVTAAGGGRRFIHAMTLGRSFSHPKKYFLIIPNAGGLLGRD